MKATLKPAIKVPENADDDVLAELAQDDALPESSSEVDIEKKYETGQAKLFIQRNDFLIPNLLQMVASKEVLDISPSYQRRARWSDIKRSHLIESLLINVPIPSIFLYEREFAKYEVMDGQQRISAIKTFFENQFPLKALKKWPELNGRRYSDLPTKIQSGLNRRGLSAVIILTESSQSDEGAMDLKQYVFERLNTGGEELNPQEVRNCIYASKFNDMLLRIARSPLFTKAWNIPPKEPGEPNKVSRKLETNRLYSTMADCEIVLRYFTLSDVDKFKGGMKRSLDSYMNAMRKTSATTCEQLEKEYSTNLDTATQIYGEGLFRLGPQGELVGRHSVPLADAVLLAIRKVKNPSKLIERKDQLVAETKKLFSTPETYEKLVGRANTKQAIVDRIAILETMMKQVV